MTKRANVPAKTEPRWRPFSFFGDLDQDLARFWDRPFFWRPALSGGEWAPLMDAYEKDGKLVIATELPGLEKEDVKVSLENGDLVLSGERHEKEDVKEENYYRSERRYGKFFRRFPLSFDVDFKKVQAHFENGILEVTVPLPKEEKAKAHEVEVN